MGIGTPFSGGMSSSVGVFGGGRPPGGRAYAGANVLVLTAETMLSPVDWDGGNELTLIVDATAASFNVILPAIAELLPGQRVTLVKVTAANTVTLVAELGETLRGNASEALAALWAVAAWVVPKVGVTWWPVSGAGGGASSPAAPTVLELTADTVLTVASWGGANELIVVFEKAVNGYISVPTIAALGAGRRLTFINKSANALISDIYPAAGDTMRGNAVESHSARWQSSTWVTPAAGTSWWPVKAQ